MGQQRGARLSCRLPHPHLCSVCAGPDPAKTYDYNCDTGSPEILVPDHYCPTHVQLGRTWSLEACAYMVTTTDEACGNQQYFFYSEVDGECSCCDQYSELNVPPALVITNAHWDIYLTCSSAGPGEAH